jgi:hypothetical protein
MADSAFCFFRFCDCRLTFSGKSILRSRVLLLHNLLRRSLSLQHPECG